MGKIQITEISVQNLEYKGERTGALEKGFHYTAVLIEGFNEECGSEIVVEIQNKEQETMRYLSFVDFASDWNILGEYKFEKAYLPIKQGE